MRILQLIDTLEVGGAERMAINYANALVSQIEFSGLIATRKEGGLKSHIQENVPFLCLNKKFSFDIVALLQLRLWCKKQKIGIVHAHGTSYFMAFLLKLVYPKIKIIWHEHAGARSAEKGRHSVVLWICSNFFSGIIVVNHTLEKWCQSVLHFNPVLYLPNFTVKDTTEKPVTFLKGNPFKRIVCLANLRIPKNHQLLLEVAIKTKNSHPDWTYHLIGKDLSDSYSQALKRMIKKNQLEETVYIYGLCEDINHIIEQATIGVLTSTSEGLPVALIEYGSHKKPVVVTQVGEIPFMIKDGFNGKMAPSNNPDLFYDALTDLLNQESFATNLGNQLYKTIQEDHSVKAIIPKYINWLTTAVCFKV